MPKGTKSPGEKEESFETALKRLEEIVQRLEQGDLPLEDSLHLFEEGVRLTRVCSQRLDRAEKRIEILMRDELGQVQAKEGNPSLFEQKSDDAEEEGQTG